MSSNSLPNAFFELIGRIKVFEENWYMDGDLYEYMYCLQTILNTYVSKFNPEDEESIIPTPRFTVLCNDIRRLDVVMITTPIPEGSKLRDVVLSPFFESLLGCVYLPGIGNYIVGLEDYNQLCESAIQEYFLSLPTGVKPIRWGWVRFLFRNLGLMQIQPFVEGPKE